MIIYNPYYTITGTEYYTLSMYSQYVSIDEHDETMNFVVGVAIDILVATVAGVLTGYWSFLAELARSVVGQAIIAGGVLVVGGIIKSPFVTTYKVRERYYNVKAIDNELSRTQYYQGSTYQIYYNNTGWGSEIIPRSYMAWDDTGVATNLFADFWGQGNCPGVSNIIYA